MSGFPEPYANVRVCVDFPGAEGIWVASAPVYPGETIAEAISSASAGVLNCLAQDAGRMFADQRQPS